MNMVVVFISLTVILAGVASSSVSADWENLLTSWVESDVDAVNAVSHSAAATDFDAELAADLSDHGGSGSGPKECASLSGPTCHPSGSWHSSIKTREGWSTCPPHVTLTRGKTCSQACAAAGLKCFRAQDNRGGCTLDSRHTRRTTANNGCEQTWNDQVCQCGVSGGAITGETNFWSRAFPGNRNNWNGECGNKIKTRQAFRISALGRSLPSSGSLTQTSTVSIWDASTHQRVASIAVGPSSPKKDGYAYAQLSSAVSLSANKEYRISQTTTSGMDNWYDSSDASLSNYLSAYATFQGGVYCGGSNCGYPSSSDGDSRRPGMVTFYIARAGYAFLFNGCPRGGKAQTWTNKGRMNKTQCEKLCDADPECNAIEVNGCLSGPQCGGECYNFHGTGSDLRNGNCVTTGDQKAYAKPASTPAPTAAPTKGGSPAPPGHYGLRDVIERSPIPQCVPGGVNNKNTYDSVNKAACFGLSQEQCESSLDCTYHSSCTASISLSKHPDADEIFKLFPSLKGKKFTCSCDETIQLAQVQQVWGSYLAGKDYRIHTNNCKAMAGSEFFGGWEDFCPKLTKRLDCVTTPWCEDAHIDAKQTRAQQMMNQLMTCAKAKCSKCGTSGYGTEQLLDTELDNVGGCDPTIWGRRRLL